MSAPCARASASRNSSLRVLLPPVDIPVQSSRLIQISGPSSARLKFGRCSSGVGRWAKRILGNRARFIGLLSHLKTESAHRHRHSAAAVRSIDLPWSGIDILTGLTRTLGFCLLASMFNAILVEREPGPCRATLRNLDEAQLPPAEVAVRIDYSTLNYKDALAITGAVHTARHHACRRRQRDAAPPGQGGGLATIEPRSGHEKTRAAH